MSDQFQVTTSEQGLIRLFALDLPSDEVAGLREAELARLLGVENIDVDQIDLFSTDDLQGLGLVGYMAEGLGIAPEDLEEDRARLEALKGHLLIVRSAAFKGQYALLTAQAPLRWIGTYPEATSAIKFEPLPSEAAKGNVTPDAKQRPSNAAMSGRVAMVVLIFLVAFTGALVWVAS